MERVPKSLAAAVAGALLAMGAVAGQAEDQAAKAPPRAAQRPAPRAEKPVPFTPGEVLTYSVSYAGLISAGRATLSVNQRRASYNSTAYHIVAEGGPTGLLARLYTLHYRVETLVDVFTLLPQRGSIVVLEGTRTRVKTTMFDRRSGTAEYEMSAPSVVKQTVKIAPSSHDALSVFVALRAMPIKPGGGATFPVCDGGRRLKVAVSTEGRETLRTDAVTAPAWRLGVNVTDEEGRLLGRGVRIWISDDARRLPMKLQAQLPVGSFVFELMKTVG